MNTTVLYKRFNDAVHAFIGKVSAELEAAKKNPNKQVKKSVEAKYAFLKTKNKLPLFTELISSVEITRQFDKDEIDHLTLRFISKITGLFKHAQAEKTSICNSRISQNIRQGKFTICITKNTLESNNQWVVRLIEKLTRDFPGEPLNQKILICSSKPDNLNGHATHCKNIDQVHTALSLGNFKILFVCSNNKRFEDMHKLMKLYDTYPEAKRLPIEIQHDESHNTEDGVPSKRVIIEHILMSVNVETYIPITASTGDIGDDSNKKKLVDNDNILWRNDTLESHAINYTSDNDIKSDSPNYSSLHDANHVYFEDLKTHPSFQDYQIEAFDRDTFLQVYDQKVVRNRLDIMLLLENTCISETKREELCKELVEINRLIDEKRQLEHCTFMKFEKDGFNTGLNILDNFVDIPDGLNTRKLFLPDKMNIHLISTPCRKVFTLSLMKYAIDKPYNPICIGLYESNINVMYKMGGSIIEEIYNDAASESSQLSAKALNEKIDDIINGLFQRGISIDVPIIIIGNYKPTGESITFVNYEYGTLQSVSVLPGVSQTPEKDYQNYCRLNYMDTLFKRKNREFVHPPKWMFGNKKNIDNALAYETINDERIDEMKLREEGVLPVIQLSESSESESDDESVGEISIPVKIVIDDVSLDSAKELYEHLKLKQRNPASKTAILRLIKAGIAEDNITIIDKTGHFNFETFTLKDVRTYRNKDKESIEDRKLKFGDKYKPFESMWRFSSYDADHIAGRPFMNDKKHVGINECEMLACNDKFAYNGVKNSIREIWLSYKYLE